MHTYPKKIDRPPILIISRIDDILIVQGKHQMVNRRHGIGVIGFHDLLRTVMRELSISYQYPHSPGGKIITRIAG